ncbi:MAG: TolC family protein, partial [Alphaproteobacteria bacterium]|nr:TolC family protein [Alphaproteobacteria bacterium]
MIKKIWCLLLLVFFSSNLRATNLAESVELAFTNNFDFQSKVENFNADFAYKGLANSYLLPQLDLQGKVGVDQSSKTYSTKTSQNISYGLGDSQSYGLTINLVQPLYNPSAWAYFSQGKLTAQRAQIVLDKEKNNLILKVAEAYFAVLAAQDDLEASKAEIDYLNKYMQEMSRKANIGQARKVDVDEVRAKYQLVKYNNFVLENNLKVQMDAFNRMLNSDVKEISRLQGDISELELTDKDLETWKSRSREQNLDILSTRLAVMLAEKDVKVASASYYPTLSIVGSVGMNGG